MSHQNKLISRLNDHTAVIGIVGLGYVGLPLMLRFTEVGYKVLGFDVDKSKIDQLNNGKSYIGHITEESIARTIECHRFEATDDFSCANEPDTLILCVPTPLNKFREPDLSYLINSVESIAPHLRSGQIVTLESTTYPGTTEEELQPRIEKQGLKIGQDVFLVYSPEREDPSNKKYLTRNIPKICAGITDNCLEVGKALYGNIIEKIVPVSDTRTAEMTKLLENIHRSVNIGLANEMKIIADRMGIDIYEVIQAAATKPFGFVPYYPGPGLGGHCIPTDPFYLTWKAKEYGLHTRFIELAGEINRFMPRFVVEKVVKALNDQKKPVFGSKILVLGIAYKRDVDDPRESPSMEIMKLLKEKGAELDYSDPFFDSFPKMREYKFDLKSIEPIEENIRKYDCVIIATDHSQLDYDLIRKSAKIIIDTRGVYQKNEKNFIRA
ncbi:MAG TPA: nucleotide sugar dehydrogenase [Verrucomicrobiales bacterium]|nr:nucleotide sugar dehydrogenase [Verrucomicrobiales bacterium]HIL70569.1 nucleotide sugar dehydrogenase [Verrucomicrobiota bacterium]